MNNNFLPYQLKKNAEQNSTLAASLAQIVQQLRVNILYPPNGSGITPAKTDGVTDIGSTLQACINYVSANGGGDIVIPFLVTGFSLQTSVTLKSNVNIISNGSVITIPSVASTKFYAINITNCSNVNFYGQLHFKSTNDKTRPVFSGLSSNVTALNINTSSDIYIQYVYGENIETVVNVYGSNLANEKNIKVDEIKYYDCNFPFFAKQYSNVWVGYIHGTIQNIALDPHDHVVYVNNNCFDIHFDVVQGNCLNTSINPVWMVQCDTNTYDTAHFSNDVTFNSIVVEGNFSGFIGAGFQNLYVGELVGNVNAPSGTFIGAYDSSKFQIGNVSLEGTIQNFMSTLGTASTLSQCTIHGGKVNASITQYVIRGTYIDRLHLRGVSFNNITATGVSTYLVESTTINYVLIENCNFTYTSTPTAYIVTVNSGVVDFKSCKFINLGSTFSQVIYNATGTTVNAYNCIISKFGTLFYYNPPSGANSNSYNGYKTDDNSILNESKGNGIKNFYGVGNPSGVVSANIGSLFFRGDGTLGNIFYLKHSGTSSGGANNAGWYPVQVIYSGTTASRPATTGLPVGFSYFDTSLNGGLGMDIKWNGTNWVNPSTGATV